MTRAERIERQHIEAKFRELQGDISDTAEDVKVPLMAVGAAIAIGVVIAAYWFGSRRGRKKTTIVEVRRF